MHEDMNPSSPFLKNTRGERVHVLVNYEMPCSCFPSLFFPCSLFTLMCKLISARAVHRDGMLIYLRSFPVNTVFKLPLYG